MSSPEPRLINRELSWLAFNARVLEEARDPSNPLLERVKFLAITASNLDEFFMVRIGGLVQLLASAEAGKAGRLAAELQEIRGRARDFITAQYDCLQTLDAALAEKGIHRRTSEQFTPLQARSIQGRFENEIFPVATPRAVAATSPLPALPALTPCLLVRLRPTGRSGPRGRFAVIPLPRNLPRLLALPAEKGYEYILLETVMQAFVDRFFPGENVEESTVFRITRNADMEVQEDLASDLLSQMRNVLQKRTSGAPVRVEIAAGISESLTGFLLKTLEITETELCPVPGPLGLNVLLALAAVPYFDALRNPAWDPQPSPQIRPGEPLFAAIAREDLLLYHPYETFDPVLRLIEEAATDPDVLALKQILYRTSRNSPVVAALVRAAGQGKQVTVIVELKARFDEARNIEEARILEQAGANVIYGIKRLKTHAKLCLIARREPTGIRRYLHFGTGNYNETTARLYTDVSYLTCDEDLAADASVFFNTITGYSQPVRYRKLEAAPIGLRRRILEMIDAEALRGKEGQAAWILGKLNSLVDTEIIEALYAASQCGVRIRLNVRGICCLRPGLRGLSENIEVVSIVDRFLEHARIFCFHHGGEPRAFISSADWMPRNLDRRIELLVPVESPPCRDRLIAILEGCFEDTAKARRLRPDGEYERVQPTAAAPAVRSQEYFYREASRQTRRTDIDRQQTFEPHRPAAESKGK